MLGNWCDPIAAIECWRLTNEQHRRGILPTGDAIGRGYTGWWLSRSSSLCRYLVHECHFPIQTGFIEVKWDGFRSLLYSDGDGVRLVSRNRNTFKSFPGLCEGLARDLNGRRCAWTGKSSALLLRAGHSSETYCSDVQSRSFKLSTFAG